MSIYQILLVLRARYKLILFTLIATTAITIGIVAVLPKTYKSTAVLLLNYKGIDPVSGVALAPQLVNGYMATQIDIVTSKGLAMKVADNMKLIDNPEFQRQYDKTGADRGAMREWLAERLQASIDVAPTRESSVLEITARAADPYTAASIANGFASAYQELNLQLKVEPQKKAASYIAEQSKVLRANLEEAENKLSAYQRAHGLVSVDNRIDVESTRLNELSSQLVVAQGQRMEAESREHMAKSDVGSKSPDVVANPMLQNMKSALSQAEAKFSQLSENLDHNHPKYQAAKAEVDQLRADLARHIADTTNGIVNNAQILRQREADVRAAMNLQRAKVLDLNEARDELAVLNREVESAQHAYDSAAQRLAQTSMEGQSNQSDVSLLTTATPSNRAASPNLLFNACLSAALGLMLGAALALVAEVAARRVRCVADLVIALRAPALGEIAWSRAS